MRIPYVAFFIFLLFPFIGQADWVLMQQVEMNSPTTRQTNQIAIKIKANKMRIDTGTTTSLIKDNDSGDQVIIMHTQKRYIVQSASKLKEAREQIKNIISSSFDNTNKSRPILHATGKTEKISGYDTEEFVWSETEAHGSYWIAKDFPNYATLLDLFEKSFDEERNIATYQLPDTRNLPGFPIRSEIVSFAIKSHLTSGPVLQSPASTNITLLISAHEQTLSDSDFDVPKDYTEAADPFSAGQKGTRQNGAHIRP